MNSKASRRTAFFTNGIENFEFTHRSKIEKLVSSTFLIKSTMDNYLTEYMPIFTSLGYRIGFLSKLGSSSSNFYQPFPPNILHITFSSLEDSQPESKIKC